MEWLAENWFWVLIGVVFIVIHLFGHRGHGHGGRREQDDYGNEDQQRKKQGTDSGHRHH